MKLKGRMLLIAAAVITVTLLGATFAASQSDDWSYGTVNIDLTFEIKNAITSGSGSTTPPNAGETVWYTLTTLDIDYERIFDMMGGSDGSESELAAASIAGLNKILTMGQDPGEDFTITGDLAGSELFIKVLRNVALPEGNAYEFIPGIKTGKDITITFNKIPGSDMVLPPTMPSGVLSYTIPSGLPIPLTGPNAAHAFDNLTLWSLIEPKEPMGGDGPMERFFGPYFSPVLGDDAATWQQNEDFLNEMLGDMISGPYAPEGLQMTYTVTYTPAPSPSAGLSLDVNANYPVGDPYSTDSFNISQTLSVDWTEARSGWINSLQLEVHPVFATPGGNEDSLIDLDLSYKETTPANAIGIQTGNTGTIKTGTMNLGVEATGDFKEEVTEPEFPVASDQLLIGYTVGNFDGLYYGLNLTEVNIGDGPGNIPEGLVVNAWNGQIYFNISGHLDDYSHEYQPAFMTVSSDTATVNFPINVSERYFKVYEHDDYGDHDYNRKMTDVLGVFLSYQFDWNKWSQGYLVGWTDVNQLAPHNYWNSSQDEFDGKSILMNDAGSLTDGQYSVIIIYTGEEEGKFGEIAYLYDGAEYPVVLEVTGGTGEARLPKFAPRYGLSILGVFLQADLNSNSDWDRIYENFGSIISTNYWYSSVSNTFDGETLVLNSLSLADGTHDIAIVALVKPLGGHGFYQPVPFGDDGGGGGGAGGASHAQDDDPAGGLLGLFVLAGGFAPAISPDWWYHSGQTTAVGQFASGAATKLQTALNYLLSEVVIGSLIPEDLILATPAIELSASATWTSPALRKINGTASFYAQVAGDDRDGWPFKDDTEIDLDLKAGFYEDWSSSGVSGTKGIQITVNFVSTNLSRRGPVFSPGFEVMVSITGIFAVALPVVIKKRRK